MSIGTELSSDVAGELLRRREEDPGIDSKTLAALAVELHNTLQELKSESNKQRHRRSRARPKDVSKAAKVEEAGTR
jgi:hypothetical protein